MAISLYDATVPGFMRTLDAASGFLQAGLDHCREANTDPDQLVATSLCSDMAPLRFQVVSIHHHSAGALKGAQEGAFGPPPRDLALDDYAALQAHVASAKTYLQGLTPETVDA
ncbi:MAG: DUF1993 family protein, partial [Caulobacterales bacterium]|nr:DUF1993 family protein [Caulobacterales bacterium]